MSQSRTTVTVKDCPSQMTLPGALVGRFDSSALPVPLRPSRRSRARSRSTGTPPTLSA